MTAGSVDIVTLDVRLPVIQFRLKLVWYPVVLPGYFIS